MRRKDQKVQTKALIIASAQRVFARLGISATRSSEVAAEAGIAHGTLFLHFPTQEELLVAAIEDFGLRISGRLHELASAGAGLRSVLEAELAGLAENEAFYARLVEENATLPRGARTTLLMIQSTISHHFEEAAETDRALGRIRAFPTHLLFNTWTGLLHHYLVNRELFAPRQSVLTCRGSELLDFYLSLIGQRAGEEGERE